MMRPIHLLHSLDATTIALSAGVGLLAGLHAAIWGTYKDAVHEGFGPARFARSIVVAALAAVGVQLAVGLPLPRPSALLLLFGLAYGIERAIVEVWKTFVRDEDQSKYFIPMQFSIAGRPMTSRPLRLLAGLAYVGAVVGGLFALAALGTDEAPLPGWRAVVTGLAVGILVAIGGGWKDAPKEGFDLLKFFRSPAMTTAWALLLANFTGSAPLLAVAAVGFERATAETWKTFFFPSKPRGKFTGKPILHPHLLRRRHALVPVYAAIWVAVLAWAAAALRENPSRGGPVAARPAEARS